MCLLTYAGIVAKHADNVKAASLSMTAQPPADMNLPHKLGSHTQTADDHWTTTSFSFSRIFSRNQDLIQ
jgi:hypothetical protein